MLAQLGQDATGGFRVKEGYVQVLSTLARGFVNQADTFLVALGQGIGHTIFNTECHMMDTTTSLVKPLLNGTLW